MYSIIFSSIGFDRSVSSGSVSISVVPLLAVTTKVEIITLTVDALERKHTERIPKRMNASRHGKGLNYDMPVCVDAQNIIDCDRLTLHVEISDVVLSQWI